MSVDLDPNSHHNRGAQLVRRGSSFATTRPVYGEAMDIVGRLRELGAPDDALAALNEWSNTLPSGKVAT